MQEQIEEYRKLLTRLVNLQQKLIRVFEADVEVVLLPSTFPGELRSMFEDIIKPGRSISQILQAWPDDVFRLPLHAWVKPRKGVVQLEGRNWLFEMHGSSKVSFVGLPSGLGADVVECLKGGNTDALNGIQMQGGGPTVDVEYLEGGRSDGVSAWSVLLFTGNEGKEIVCPRGGEASESDHQCLLQALVREGFLRPWNPLFGGGRFFVLTESEASA